MNSCIKKIAPFLYFSIIIGAEVDTSFSVKWTDLPWGSGGLHPDGPPWSMVGPYDFDNDGYGDFIMTSSCLLYTSPSPRDKRQSRMPSSA